MIYVIQISMFFAGIATLLQTIGVGPVGARLPLVQGTSFAFVPIMVSLVAGKGVDAIAILTRGILSVAAVLIGVLASYAIAFAMGMVDFGNVGRAAAVALPKPSHFGVEFAAAAIIGFCAMAFISAVDTVGDVSGIT